MLKASCHCGAVTIQVPRKPRSITNCNCSMCRRYGVLWACYKDAEVRLEAAPDAVGRYAWGRKSQDFIRCRTCGCVMQWKKKVVGPKTWTGVNARNFEPEAIGKAKILLLDGANTWKYVKWSPLPSEA
jgi:hypothetical protein